MNGDTAGALYVSRFQQLTGALRASDGWSVRSPWPPLTVAALYYGGCLIGFGLRFPASGISFFWPPTAILTAALTVTAPRMWPPLLAGALVAHGIAHTQDGVPFVPWLIQFFANAVQAVLAAGIARYASAGTSLFADSRRVLIFIVGACLLAPAVASLVPAYIYVELGWATDFAQAWRARTVSNAIATLAMVPSLVTLWHYLCSQPFRVPPRILEFCALLLGVVAVHFAVGYIQRTDILGVSAALFAPTPFLLWATVRFRTAGLAVALLWTTLLTVSTALAGQGPLAGGTPADAVVGVQLVLTANAIPMMLMAGVLEQGRIERRALIDIEQQNSAILRAVPDVMFLQTREGVCLRSFLQTTDPRSRQLVPTVGLRIQDTLPQELALLFSRKLATVTLDTPSIVEYTHTIQGVAHRLEARLIGVDAERVLTIIRDITERWQSEQALRETQQRYALATAAGGIGVWDFDVRTNHVRVEGRLKAMLGYQLHEIGDQLHHWEALIFREDRQEVMSRLAVVSGGEASTFEAEFRMVHKNGSLRWIATRGAITDVADGKPARVRGTYTDTTQQKDAARSLSEANEAVVRMGRIAAMAEVSASIAHELKQPLAAITANAATGLRWIDAGVTDERVHEILRDLLDDSRRASDIVDRTKNLFLKQPSQEGQLLLNDVVRRTLDVAEPRLQSANVSVTLRLEEPLPTVLGDAVQIQQVLLNLVTNGMEAIQDVNDNRRSLRISTRQGKRHIVVSVRDTGRGFSSQEMTRVFEPFYTTKPSGTGMGLTISRSIIKKHGGRLWAVANVDRGATFRFTIPLADSAQA